MRYEYACARLDEHESMRGYYGRQNEKRVVTAFGIVACGAAPPLILTPFCLSLPF